MSTLSAPEVVLAVENVSLHFGGVRALTDVSFDVRHGELLSVIGPNGAGKSSLLNCVNGVYWPQTGTVRLQGEPLARARPREAALRGVGRTFQHVALFGGMNVSDNIMTGRNLLMRHGVAAQALGFGPSRSEERRHRERVSQIIDYLALTPYSDSDPTQLPYGLQKRVDLGRALAMEPKLLLLDEPMAGMNIEEKIDMCTFILSARASFGASVLLIEHDIALVMDLSDRIVVLDYGKKIGDGTPAEIRENPEVVSAYLGLKH